jgi:hypothetical protein
MAVTGCGTNPVASLPPVPSEQPTLPATGNLGLLARVVATPDDVGAEFTVTDESTPGSPVGTDATLSLCGAPFTTEADRIAVLRTGVRASNTSLDLIATEAVLYSSAADTATAFAELASAEATCPKGFVSSGPGAPAIKSVFVPAPDKGWPTTPGVTRLVIERTVTNQAGATATQETAYLRRGRVLVSITFDEPTNAQPAIELMSTPQSITVLFQNRLAALPAAAVA